MLNFVSKVCSSLFLVTILTVQGYADEHFPFLAEVSRDSVNVRAGANINFEKVDKLKRGDQVVVLGHSYEWYKVEPLATTKLYIRSDYVEIKEGGLVAEVLGDRVNVRAAANSDAVSLGQIKKGALVKVLEQIHGWCRLAPMQGTAVWIHQDFLKMVSPQVPEAMLIAPVVWSPPAVSVRAAPSVAATQSVTTNEPSVTKMVSLRGTVTSVRDAQAQAHYQLVVDGKPAYYLEDMPHLPFFDQTVVDVTGTVLAHPDKKSACPLLHIDKISLVL